MVGNWTPILRVLNEGTTERIVSEARDNSNVCVRRRGRKAQREKWRNCGEAVKKWS